MSRAEALEKAIEAAHASSSTASAEYKQAHATRSLAWSAIAALIPKPYYNTGPK